MEVYHAESAAIMAILQNFTPLIEQVSVDEAYLDVSACLASGLEPDAAIEAARPLAMKIKQRIRAERGLTASVGISSNKFLAKLASDFNKPDGITLILDSAKVAFLRPLPVGAIHGVGPVTAQGLQALGLHTIGDLQDSTQSLDAVAGSFSVKLRERAFGHDNRPLDLSDERKSISAEHTFRTDTGDRGRLRAALKEMALDVAQTLGRHGLGALTVQVKVRYSDFTTLTRQIRVEEPVASERDLYRLACFLLARHQLVSGPLRLLGIGVSTLMAPTQQQLRLRL
jgi:DNA polymerase-4